MESEKKSSTVSNVGAWAMNIVSSVGIIMANKQLMSSNGYAFTFATTLTGFHFAVTALVGLVSNATGYSASKHVPMWELLWFSIVANMSITGMNFSLMLNSVGFYQISKLSMIPVVCVMEWILHSKRYSKEVKWSEDNMDIQNILHMNVGNGASSYAKNSFLQECVIRKAWPVLEETIKLMILNDHEFSDCFKIADLGCSSGPNTFFVISNIINTINSWRQENHRKAPEFQVCLNDLPNNDFNTIFKILPTFYAKLERDEGEKFGPCLISAVPGSFYGRLFPKESMHLVHSSYSLHYLSRVPEGLENNKGTIYMAKTSPVDVLDAYLKQYQKDFSTFLKLRSVEMIPNGHMVLTFIGRSVADPTSKDCCYLWELLTKSLLDLVAERMIREADVDSFNVPCYFPYKDEVTEIIHREGSFIVDRLDTFEMNWDAEDDEDNKDFVFDKFISRKNVAKTIRAAMEPMLATHFGNNIIDKVFERYSAHVSEHLSNYKEKTKHFNIVVSMTKK